MNVLRYILISALLLSLNVNNAHSQDNIKIIEKKDSEITFQLDFKNPEVRTVQIGEQSFNELTSEGLSTLETPGQAPVYLQNIILPVMNETMEARVVDISSARMHVGRLAPTRELTAPNEKSVKRLKIDAAYFNQDRYLPDQNLKLVRLGDFRGNTLYALKVFPYQYNPVTGELLIHTKMVVSITYTQTSETVSFRNSTLKDKQLLGELTHPDFIRTSQIARTDVPQAWSVTQSSVDEPQIKIFVDTDGLYQIAYEDLDTLDLDLSEISPQRIKIKNMGRQIPIRVIGGEDGRFDPGDVIEFWGEFNKKTFLDKADDMFLDPFEDDNIYWLSWGEGNGIRMVEEDGSISELDPTRFITPFSYEFKVHEEKDRFFDRLSQVPPGLRDHWFYDNGVEAGEKKDYSVFLPHPDVQAIQSAHVKVMLHGQTFSADVEHHVSAFLNFRKVFEGAWSGQEKFDLETPEGAGVIASALQHGANTLTLINEVPASQISNVLLNWFEISYQRLYKADQDQILFGIPKNRGLGLYDFKINGFTVPEITLYKLGSSEIIGTDVRLVTDFQGEKSYQLHFQDEVFSEDVQYFAVTKEQKLKPKKFIVDTPSDLRSPANGADYIVIAPEVFLENASLSELVNFRESEGLRSKLVWDQDIYDEFNSGIRSPYAIKKFLKYAFENWQPPAPLFVLFVGDGSFDNKDILQKGGNLLPLYLFQAEDFGATASDHWFALISGQDQIPDLIVGRFPVATTEQLDAIVRKTLDYESSSSLGSWRNRFLFIGGNRDVFRSQSETLINASLPTNYDPVRLYTEEDKQLPVDPYFGGTSTLINFYDEGVGLINYMGHGSGGIWSDNNLFDLAAVNRLNNTGRYPIITSMTCFAGAFDEPGRKSLSEALLGIADKGAVALWASSGFAWSLNDFFIVREFFQNYFEGESARTLGEYILKTKIDYFSNINDLSFFHDIIISMINQYNILGDPALVAGVPKKSVKLQVDRFNHDPGETLHVKAESPVNSGIAEVALLNYRRDVITVTSTPVESGAFELDIQIPENFPKREAYIRTYVYNESQRDEANGSVRLVISGTSVENLRTIPEFPTGKDSLRFSVQIQAPNPITQVNVLFDKPNTLADLPMTRINDSGLWETEQAIAPAAPSGGDIAFRVWYVDNSGKVDTSTSKVTRISKGVDLSTTRDFITLGGTEFVTIKTKVTNEGDAPVQDAEISFFQKGPNESNWKFIGKDSVSVSPSDSATAETPVYPGTGLTSFLVKIDPDDQLGEFNTSNNMDSTEILIDKINLDAGLGSTLFGTANDTIDFRNGLSFYLPPNSIDNNRVLSLSTRPAGRIFNQPDFSFVAGGEQAKAFQLSDNVGANASFSQPCWLAITFELPDSAATFLNELNIYRFDETTLKWIRQESHLTGPNQASALVARLGTFAVMRSTDRKAPKVEVKVEGQLFAENSFVPKNPVITAVAQDENGIDISENKIRILLDEQLIPVDQITFQDSLTDANTYAMSLHPNLTGGEHLFKFQVVDANGNESLPAELKVKIAENADVRVLGTYPNPFKRRTTFAYELTQRADDLQLKIYTASGRLIRKFEAPEILDDPNPLSPDYHEISWDATDDFGSEVANGLYFYKLRATFAGQVIERVGKVARIR